MTSRGAFAADRYLLFELRPTAVRCNGYGDVTFPNVDGGAPALIPMETR